MPQESTCTVGKHKLTMDEGALQLQPWYAVARSPDGWVVVLMGFGTIATTGREQARTNCLRRRIDPATLVFLPEDELRQRFPGVADNFNLLMESAALRHMAEVKFRLGL